MKVVALISGGKDSCFNMMHCVANGHQITALANLHPAPTSSDELDSWMYQTVGHDIVELYAEAMNLPMYKEIIRGSNVETGLHYSQASGDETEDMYRLLQRVIIEQPDIKGISVGAIASNYQRLRVENVASRLQLTVLSYLWERDQSILLREMIAMDVEAILIKVACVGLDSRHLGLTLAQVEHKMTQLHQKYKAHPCGEGGEYETIVLDCPLFVKKLKVTASEVVQVEGDTAYLRLKAEIAEKEVNVTAWRDQLIKAAELQEEYQELLEDLKSMNDLASTEPSSDEAELITDIDPQIGPLTDQTLSSASFTCSRYVITRSESRLSLKSLLPAETADITFCFLILSDMSDFTSINAEYAKLWSSNTVHPPSRVCISTSLPENVQYLLLTIQPILTSRRDDDDDDDEDDTVVRTEERRVWVQSTSHWAPANIGPYSQLTSTPALLTVSGQIGLVPGSMVLPDSIDLEISWSLQSLERVLKTQGNKATLQGPDHGIVICYIVNSCQQSQSSRCIRRKVKAGFEVFNRGRYMELVIVELLRGSQLPRSATIEWQLLSSPTSCSSADAIRITVNPEIESMQREAGDELEIKFSTLGNAGFWTILVARIEYANRCYSSISVHL